MFKNPTITTSPDGETKIVTFFLDSKEDSSATLVCEFISVDENCEHKEINEMVNTNNFAWKK